MSTNMALAVPTDHANELQAGAAPSSRQAMIEVAASRAAQEVQAAMVVAKRFPRDETTAYNRVMQACRRKGLAEQALYAYPRGNTTVTGPSIRLAEVLAQSWGNLDFGIIELEQRRGESTVMAYAWDLETNTRQTKIFTVKHERHTRQGTTLLTDPRDIYEMTANQGARRLRACVLGIVPGDVVEAAVVECEKTMAGGNSEPIIDRARKMVAAFADFGVSQAMIEKRLGHVITTIIEAEMVCLRKIYLALKDNMADRNDYFRQDESEAGPAKPRTEALAEKLGAPATAKPEPDTKAGPARKPAKDFFAEDPEDGPDPTD